jgi:branched-chain amino acid transport system ATP-binding protein
MLDEPSEGMAPLVAQQLAASIVELKRQGMSVLLSEQNLAFAALVCDRVVLLDQGQIRFLGSMQQLLDDEVLTRSYLTL